MKKILLFGSLIASALVSQAQIVVNGVSPVAVQKSFEYGSTTGVTASATSVGPWGAALATTYVKDTLRLVDDNTAGDSLGCTPLVNDLSGKIAVVYRGGCTFFEKVKNAQTAGALAVIIVNNTTGIITPSSAPANANSTITIPIITISQDDGALLHTQMALGYVVMEIGNLTGLYTNNLGIYSLHLL